MESKWRPMKKIVHVGIVQIAAFILCLPAFSQVTVPVGAPLAVTPTLLASTDGVNGTDEPILTIKKRVDEVNVLFIATDRHGKFVRNLNQGDFSILDDHKPVQSISNFRRETDLPIQMGLLVDMSASVHGRFDFEKEAASGFLQHVVRPGYDKAFIMGFNKNSHVTQDFTDNVGLLSAGVRELVGGGGTALYDAIYKACKEKLHDRFDHPVRKAIIVVSDGEDNQSEVTRAQAIEMAQRP